LLERIANGEPCKGDLPELTGWIKKSFRNSTA
jgi:hypothetical protein